MANKSAEAAAKAASPEDIKKQLVLTGADIVLLGESGELLVGGKNYNTAIISQIKEIQAPHFRAISSVAFHRVLDETKVNSRIVRKMVDQEYNRIDWNDPEINRDPDYLQKFVRQLGKQVAQAQQESGEPGSTKL
ncbi:MAG: phosphoenolpyruvate synthase, partial [Desulfovibrio sp.]|nr:phosphoenolpyruvate synthase [Desulfovibrio sp.]